MYCKGGEGYAGPPKPVHPEPGYHHPEPSYHAGESINKQHGKKTTLPNNVHNKKKQNNKTEDLLASSIINSSDPLSKNQSFQKSQNPSQSFQGLKSQNSTRNQISKSSTSQNLHAHQKQPQNSSQNVPKYKFLIPNPSNWLREMREIRDNVPPKVKHKIAYSKIIPPVTTSKAIICDTRVKLTKMERAKNICEHNSQQFAGRCFCCFLTVSILFYPVVFITLMFMYHPFHE